MKKKYFAPEMEEVEMGKLELLEGSECPPVTSEPGTGTVCTGITVDPSDI